MRTEQELKEAVDRGIQWLDENEPLWFDKIAMDELCMNDDCLCVLGQLSISRSYGNFIEEYDLDEAWAMDHGFIASHIIVDEYARYNYGEYTTLDELWSEVIEKRLVDAGLMIKDF